MFFSFIFMLDLGIFMLKVIFQKWNPVPIENNATAIENEASLITVQHKGIIQEPSGFQ